MDSLWAHYGLTQKKLHKKGNVIAVTLPLLLIILENALRTLHLICLYLLFD